MKYGKGTNKGTLKVRRKCSTATVKVQLRSTELVQSHKACFNRTYNVHKVMHGNYFLAPTVTAWQEKKVLFSSTEGRKFKLVWKGC